MSLILYCCKEGILAIPVTVVARRKDFGHTALLVYHTLVCIGTIGIYPLSIFYPHHNQHHSVSFAMGAMDRGLPLALGTLAVSSGLALLTFDILFSISLSREAPESGVRIVAIVASGVEGVAISTLVGLVVRQIRYRSQIQDLGYGRRCTYSLAGVGGILGTAAAAASATTFGLLRSKPILSNVQFGSTVEHLIVGGFVAWAAALVSLAAFIICMLVMQRRDFQQHIRPYRSEIERQDEAVVEDMELPSTPKSRRALTDREKTPNETKTPPTSSERSRSGSIRSSLSHVMRPVTSKTRLVSKSSPYRGPSVESHRESDSIADDGFDSWDTSTVDAQSRQAVEQVSPTPPRFLETIPASPTGSRSPSPGFPLDLQPPSKTRRRSRSFSPSTSYKDLSNLPQATSPDSPRHEGHIHPLFRTDSPTPPPSATPGTQVVAAPGNGLLISDRQSIRSLTRMRSGSLPASSIIHSPSLDSIRAAIEREERGRDHEQTDVGVERTLTPPIPDFVMHGTPRNSMQGYARRKVSARGLNKVGEDVEV